jgi:hypothetical protein
VNDTMRRAFAHAEQALSAWHADESEAAVALRQVKTGAAAQ